MITEYELGWIIGILEGEATFGFYSGTQRVAIEMCDEDTMVRIAVILSKVCDTIIPLCEFDRPNRVNSENHSTMFRLQVSGPKARIIMKFAIKHMGKRRRARIWQALNKYTEPKRLETRAELRNILQFKVV